MAQRTRRLGLSPSFGAFVGSAGLAVTCALLLAQAAHPPRARACSCREVPRVEAFETAASVFEGRVLEVVSANDERMNNRVTFEVVRTWKGANRERFEVLTAQSSASCGYGFEVGASYLVYTYDADGGEHTSLCGRNAPMESESAEADVAAMGAGVTPVEPTRERESDVAVAPPVTQPPPLAQRSGGCASCAIATGSRLAPTPMAWALVLPMTLLVCAARRRRSRPRRP